MDLHEAQRLFSVEEYHRMAEAGILHEDDRVELIEGRIIRMAAIGSRHAACVKRLIALLASRTAGDAIVSAQDPVQLPDYSEPEPDVALLRPRADFYARAHPTPDDVLLVIEVSDTSPEYDREVKLLLYARAGIPEAWIVDLNREEVWTYSRPEDGSYGRIRGVGRGKSIALEKMPGLTVEVGEILG